MGELAAFDINALLNSMGSSPFQAMFYIFTHGGWLIFIYVFWYLFKLGWLEWRQTLHMRQKQWIVLAIDVPKNTEKDPGQALRGVENIFAHLAGAHSSHSWVDKWIKGAVQDQISFEIVSIEGNIQFIIFTTRQFRDLIEASIYSQYPEAQISEVEDYAKQVPSSYPDPEYDAWGTEMIPAPNKLSTDIFPLKTYPVFEHSMSGELKDPLAVLLEGFSRLGPGEQAWLQFVAVPIEQKEYQQLGQIVIKKLKGEKIESKPSLLEKIVLAPFNLFIMIANEFMGSAAAPAKKDDKGMDLRMFNLSPGERKVLEATENKLSKIAYKTKIRFLYIGKKQVFKKPKVINSFVGFMKQMNANDMLSLKPELRKVGLSGSFWFFKDKRNNWHKTKLIAHYKSRSAWDGMPPHYMCTRRAGYLLHFPHTFQVKAPHLKKREAKTVEPPYNLPQV